MLNTENGDLEFMLLGWFYQGRSDAMSVDGPTKKAGTSIMLLT
jgi:hypothetical protein